ncbi:hypothetical protein Pint_31497 [Pistacia integerrima]|uniref:Uncharacterized protein n=1 Tax=Pistacia integerrima TaxID=434235 RepID=A0ACC0XQ98_9ROSI|nr:hypothetical protein Pint_31497 [Pistacia integerrima]
MATNKERIENLEAGLGGLQNNLSRIEMGVSDKLHQLEDAISKISEVLPFNRATSTSNNSELNDDPTEWFTRVDQFFEYQGTLESQKVSLASFHLEGEANQWWQWLRRSYKEEGKEVTWEIFQEELWVECEDFDEALSKVKQLGSLRDYQKEFERLGNRVQGWTQKALVGTFMGGLKPEIVDGIIMFKPKSLKEAISLARMRDKQLIRQRKATRPFNRPIADSYSLTKFETALPMKRLTWDEMQKRRAQGLCFNCDEKFTLGHRCKGAQLLLLEGNNEYSNDEET